MSIYIPTWLYIKQHNVSGLRYFGKTTAKDPFKYKGSGVAWKAHLLEFGNNVSTLWAQQFDNREELETYARTFSKENNIVESTEWANLIPENGVNGGSCKGRKVSESRLEKIRSRTRSNESKENISRSLRGKPKSLEASRKSAASRTGLKRSTESREKMSLWQKGKLLAADHKQKIKDAKNSPEGKQKMKDAWEKRRARKHSTE